MLHNAYSATAKNGGNMLFTLQQAADATGKDKSTIQRAIKSGKLSATRNTDRTYSIDSSELQRVYVLHNADITQQALQHGATTDATNAMETLQAKIELLQMQVEIMRETTQDLRTRLDNSDQERRQLLAMLTHQQPEPKQPIKSKLFDKLFGRRGQ